MPKNVDVRLIDSPYDSSLRRSGSTSSSSSGAAGAPSPHDLDSTHHSGTLSWANVNKTGSSLSDLATRTHSSLTGIGLADHHDLVTAGNSGLSVPASPSQVVSLNLATDPGLELSTGVRVKAYFGITRDSNGIGVKLLSGMTALAVDTNGLAIANAIAGAGLTINTTTKVLAVGAGDGIDVNADDVAVDVTDIIDTDFGLYEPTTNNIGIKLATNSGLTFSTGALTLGAGTTITLATTNSVTTTTHAHAITTSTDVGTTPAAAILASTSGGALTLAQLTLRGNLVFAGGDRSITASNNLTLAPTTDLILDPTGLILLPNAQEMKTSTFSDLVTGISGMRFWDRGSNYRQLTIGAMKMDELYARVFVADETRIDRGEEYWSKSYGVVETDFVLPADEATVNVWFENATGVGTGNIFSVGDWLLFRTIDWSSSISIVKVWFTVTALVTAGTVDGYRQQWTIKRETGGTTGQTIKKGNTALDAGQVGQGWIHLSALAQDGGPFIQIGDFTSIVSSDTPVFTNRVRMGNLNGVVDYATNTWGQAAGNDLGQTPSTGYSGYTVDATNGLRIFNTEIVLYESSTPMVKLNESTGMTIDFDSAAGATVGRYIRWQDDVNTIDADNNARIGGYKNGSANGLGLLVTSSSANSEIRMDAFNIANGDFSQLFLYSTYALLQHKAGLGWRSDPANGVIVGRVDANASSRFHVYENTTATGAAAGATIEQGSTGDAVQHFYLTGGQYWSVGIDNSASDAFVISRSSDLGTNPVVSLDLATGSVAITGVDAGVGTASTVLSITKPATTRGEIARLVAGVTSGTAPYLAIESRLQGGTVTERMRFDAAGNTGLAGATAPAGLVQIGTNGLLLELKNAISDISTAESAIWVTGGAAGGIRPNEGKHIVIQARSSAARDIIFVTGAAERMTILDDGNVGIGTATPGENLIGTTDYASGARVLQVDGTEAAFLVRGSLTAKFDLIDTGGTANQRWFRFVMDGNRSYLRAIDDNDFAYKSLLTFDHNTGAAGIGTTNPVGTEANSRFVVEGSDATALYSSIINTGAGQVALALRRTGTTPSRWIMYLPGASPQLRFYNDTLGDDVMTLSELGYVGINEANPATMLDVGAEGVNSIRSTIYGNTAYFNYVGRRALGTKASPTQITNGQILASFGGLGYTSSGWAATTSAEIRMTATESFTSTARGTKLLFSVTKAGTTTLSTGLDIGDDRQFFAPGVDAHTTASAANVNVETTSGWLRRSTSARRYKTDIRPMPLQGDLFDALQPVVYKPANGVGGEWRDYPGLIAEDVVDAGGADFVTFNRQGQADYVMYDRLVVLTISELQQLKRRVAELEMRLN